RSWRGCVDFDVALLKNGGAWAITQAVSAHLYPQEDVDGIQFASRHGDEMGLWCLYEQPHDLRVSSHLLRLGEVDLTPDTPDTPEVQQALEMLGLRWAPTS